MRVHDLATGIIPSLIALAAREGVDPRTVTRLLPLAFLAPDIVAAIVAGTQPADLTIDALTKRIDLPVDWAAQRFAWLWAANDNLATAWKDIAASQPSGTSLTCRIKTLNTKAQRVAAPALYAE